MDKIETGVLNKQDYVDLLLLADPSEEMIARYLSDGEMSVLSVDEQVICAAVVTKVSDTACELKNLAVAAGEQRKGYGRAMVRFLFEHYGARFDVMLVGTTPAGMGFYRKLGFAYSHTVQGFFFSYPKPVYEDGERCVDMLYLKKDLHSGE